MLASVLNLKMDADLFRVPYRGVEVMENLLEETSADKCF